MAPLMTFGLAGHDVGLKCQDVDAFDHLALNPLAQA